MLSVINSYFITSNNSSNELIYDKDINDFVLIGKINKIPEPPILISMRKNKPINEIIRIKVKYSDFNEYKKVLKKKNKNLRRKQQRNNKKKRI